MWEDLPPLRELQADNDDAWNRLSQRLRPTLVRFAREKGVPPLAEEDCDEAVSDAFVQLSAQLKKSADSVTVPSWLFLATHRRVLDRLDAAYAKKRGRASTGSLDQMINETGDTFAACPPPPPELDKRQTTCVAIELQRLFPKLDDISCRLLVEKHCNEERIEALAVRYQLSPTNVSTKLSRGLSEIREGLKKNPKLLQEIRNLLRLD